ncbi:MULTISPECIES: enoyl-CoA hydratase/isomerase family protein [unclassified Novosphingobium]|uniref:enoyl-CoA hydratase/isomerase family protein n=1 Tax=unclassified Novosphingobium TaxID=2644732 RepID=UPI000D322738|nr:MULTISPECIES: enoyl-CoA hydratase-related protein [unclassified Novosphingobium]PTR12579.1 enoyl-CoA hydratase [Novosphingobium sp. GV055]PUB06363.1 enoyl-CoA hydratase [Novosphingobium sp. GV061]PUB22414.1 enoyl-CoA hydratase [Novosphingobium sp. GV079]PUB44439.1 enoyl-CoA hydratase [Novosphingobium sp. GV027]
MPAIDPSRYEWIKIAKSDDGIATLTLNNPRRKNAVSRPMHREIERIWDEIDQDDDILVSILTGEGDAFCAGTDLSVQNADNESGRKGRPPTRSARKLFWSMLDAEKPIIAKVRGPAYGVGVNIALACDMVIAAEGAKFCDSHVRHGIAPGDGGVAFFPLLLGFHRAKEYLMLGEAIEASKAAAIGLINYCVPDAELDAFVDGYAKRLAKGAPLAIAYGKMSVNLLIKQMTAGAFEASLAYDQLTLFTDDHKEGARAFLEKRTPDFKGS